MVMGNDFLENVLEQSGMSSAPSRKALNDEIKMLKERLDKLVTYFEENFTAIDISFEEFRKEMKALEGLAKKL